MDIKEYISSGILELYVSGALPEADAQEVQENSEKHPEILAEIEAIESAIVSYMTSFVGKKRRVPVLGTEDLGNSVETIAPVLEKTEAVIKPFNWRIWAVAASVLLFTSVLLNIYFFQQWQDSNVQIAMLTETNTQLADSYNRLQTNYQDAIDVIGNPLFIQVAMERASEELPESYLANVFWNPSSEEVFVQVRDLPDLNEEIAQYQLWAIKAGENPISLGVFDKKLDLQNQNIKIGGEVLAFAVSEEPKGGSAAPTDGNIRVLGYVSQGS